MRRGMTRERAPESVAVGMWTARYRLGAFNAPGQSTPHQHHDSILKDEAVEPPQIVIILRFLIVVLITI
jgi:hypothetical protein